MAPPSSTSMKSAIVGAVSNMSVQYNLQAASIALAFMKSQYPQPAWVKNTLLGAVFAGALTGMTFMGYLGDVIGRRRAMLLTLSLVVIGALITALGSWGDDLYVVICAARFLIGVGVGGIYPLAAATAAENKNSDEAASKSKEEEDTELVERVGWAFFWQTPGSMMPYAFAWLLLALPSSTPDLTSVQFRMVLGFGALPAVIVWLVSFMSEESASYKKAQVDKAAAGGGGEEEQEESDLRVSSGTFLERHGPYLATLAGTGGTWLLFDVAYYGTNIFTPQILSAIFGPSESLNALCWQSLAVQAMGLPATILSIKLMPRWGSRAVNTAGFALMALSFAAMAMLFGAYPASGTASNGKFALFAAITFAINFGPNVATYVTPALLFPTAVRSRYHGASAAAGKVGAVIGSFMYAPIADGPGGLAAVMWVQVVLCLLGCVVAFMLLPAFRAPSGAPSDGDEEELGNGEERGASWSKDAPLLKN